MATFPWAARTLTADISNSTLNNKADAVLMGPTTVFDNSSSLSPHARIEIYLPSFTPATTGDCYIEVYAIKSVDGTNYEEAPAIGGADVNTLIDTIPIQPGSSVIRRVISRIILLDPYKYKFYFGNQMNGTTNSAGNLVKISHGTLKSV